MGRLPLLKPTFCHVSRRWVLSIPPHLSTTGKRRRERFKTKEQAEGRAEFLADLQNRQEESLAKHARPDLLRQALECEEIASSLGFDSLKQAFLTLSTEWEARTRTLSLGALFDAFELDRSANWSTRYTSTRWKPFRAKFADLMKRPIGTLDADFWRGWLADYSKTAKPAPATYNQILSMLRALFAHDKALSVIGAIPLAGLPARKIPARKIAVLSPQEARALLDWSHENDPSMVPYFAIGLFAGLRPQSELAILRFEHIDLEERLLDVHTTKTAERPRRQVPIEENLAAWLAPYSRKSGPVRPKNFVRKFNAARAGAASILFPDAEAPVFPWGDDIMRHSYGSYYEAKHRGEENGAAQLMYNMGHSSRKTFEAYYHNFRTRKEADLWYAIAPPSSGKIVGLGASA